MDAKLVGFDLEEVDFRLGTRGLPRGMRSSKHTYGEAYRDTP